MNTHPGLTARLIRGSVLTVAVAGFTLLTPWALIRYIGWPLPTRLPTRDEAAIAINSLPNLPDGFLINLFACGIWLCWAIFTIGLIRAAITIARDLADGEAITPIGPLQTLAAAMIGATLTTIHTTPAAATAPVPAATAPQRPGTGTTGPAAAEPSTSTPPEDQHAADVQTRTSRIHFDFDSDRLNEPARQRLNDTVAFIQRYAEPETTITITGHADSTGPADYNQHLSERRARTVAEALKNTPLEEHHDTLVSGRGETEPFENDTYANGEPNHAARAQNRRVELTYELKRPPSPTDEVTPPPRESAGSPTSHPPTRSLNPPHSNEEDAAVSWALLGGASGLLAAGLITALTMRRKRQQQRRRPGQRIRLPQPPSHLEEELRGAAGEITPDLLDRALRHLAQTTDPPPGIVGSRLSAEDLELVLTDRPGGAPPPFRRASDSCWHLAGPLPDQSRGEGAAPYPLLVTFGAASSGAQVLVNLAEIGSIGLDGSPLHVEEVLTPLALELATSPWAERVVVTCVGFGAGLTEISPKRGILRAEPTIAAYLQNLSTTDPAEPQGAAHAVLSVIPFSDGEAAELAHHVTDGDPGTPDAVLVASPGNAMPTAWTLDATPEADVDLAELGTAVLQRMSAAEVQQIIEIFHVADAPDEPAGPDAPPVPDEPSPPPAQSSTPPAPDTQDGATDHPAVLVLGTVELAGRDLEAVEPGKRRLLVELAAYLKFCPGRSAEEVSRAMGGPRGPWSPATRASNMSRLRAWLGKNPDGRNYVPSQTEGTLYTLNNEVRCDWDDFQHLSERGLRAGTEGIADLQAALALVRGQPFADTAASRYAWAEPLRQEMISAIVDTAHALALHLTDFGDPAEARAILTRALQVEPVSELLYRDLFRAEHRAGNLNGIANAAQRLMLSLEQIDSDMEPETQELIDALLHRH